MNYDVGEATEELENERSSFSNLSVTSPTSQLILQPFRRFTYVTAHSQPFRFFTYVKVHYPTLFSLLLSHKLCHSPTFPSLHLRHNSFSNPSVALPTSQLILQPFRRFTYVTTHSQPFCCFTYVTVHSPTLFWLLLSHKLCSSPTFSSLYLRHNSLSNPSVA